MDKAAGDYMRKLVLILITSAVLLLQGCGFHLRGKVELPPVLDTVYVEGADPDLVNDLKDSLDFSGAAVVYSASAATSAILVESRYDREVRTLNSRGVATGYLLRYDARFVVVSPEGESRYESRIISIKRNFDFNPEQVLQKEEEEDFLREKMREEIVQRIMRQLSTI